MPATAVADWIIEPVTIGPTWRRNPDWDGLDPIGEFILPELTLGWQILDWVEKNLLGDDGDYFRATPEQKRFILWWYAIDEDGRFVYRDGVLQRLKGWGKDPLVAIICAVELIGPCRFAGWATRDLPEIGVMQGEPVARENPVAWIDVAAVSKEQTGNTMSLFPSMFTEACKKRHGMTKASIGKEIIYAHGGARKIRAVTSSPRALEGGRATFVVRNETHHWLESNNGHGMADVIERNATKSKGGAARALSITNAYEPSENSVAQRQREAWEAEEEGLAIRTGVLYDSLEAPEDCGLTPPRATGAPEPTEAEIRAWLAAVIRAVRGDAWWLDIHRITNSILSRENAPSKSRRYWFNQIAASEDAWVDPAAVNAGEDPLVRAQRKRILSSDPMDVLRAGWIVARHEPIVMFGDGSKSDDSTALVGYRLSDGYTFLIGVWARPTGDAGRGWLAPREAVDARVDQAMQRFNIVAFWFDPSHALDDDDVHYWDGYVDKWHRKYKDRLQLWSVKTGPTQHSIMWDMTSPARHAEFVASCKNVQAKIENRDPITDDYKPLFLHDGHPALKNHLKNARRAPVTLSNGRFGVSVRKQSRESVKKIDIAVCVIGAHMLGRYVLNVGLQPVRRGGYATAV